MDVKRPYNKGSITCLTTIHHQQSHLSNKTVRLVQGKLSRPPPIPILKGSTFLFTIDIIKLRVIAVKKKAIYVEC